MNWKILCGILAFIAIAAMVPDIRPLRPLNDIRNTTVDFEWGGRPGPYRLLIDDNPGFGTPDIYRTAETRYRTELEYGEFFWKVEGPIASSGVQRFRVVSTVAVSLNETTDGIIIENGGDVDLSLTIPGVVGAVVLPVGKYTEVNRTPGITAEQK
ncbi:MAG: hypothetical protein ABH879_06320 [archaeon]